MQEVREKGLEVKNLIRGRWEAQSAIYSWMRRV
jgi:hypothetical protein